MTWMFDGVDQGRDGGYAGFANDGTLLRDSSMTFRFSNFLQLLAICLVGACLGMATMYIAMGGASAPQVFFAESCAPSI